MKNTSIRFCIYVISIFLIISCSNDSDDTETTATSGNTQTTSTISIPEFTDSNSTGSITKNTGGSITFGQGGGTILFDDTLSTTTPLRVTLEGKFNGSIIRPKLYGTWSGTEIENALEMDIKRNFGATANTLDVDLYDGATLVGSFSYAGTFNVGDEFKLRYEVDTSGTTLGFKAWAALAASFDDTPIIDSSTDTTINWGNFKLPPASENRYGLNGDSIELFAVRLDTGF